MEINGYIEFTFDTSGGNTLTVEGELVDGKVKFKAYNIDGDLVKKSTLTKSDVELIEEFILENAEEIDSVDEFYDRYDSF